LREEAAIGDAAGEWKTFGLRLDRKLRRREDVPDGVAPPYIGIGRVAGVIGQVQILGSELADTLRRLEVRLEIRGRRRVGEPGVDRARGGEQLKVPADRLRVVRERFATRDEGGDEESHERLHAKRPVRRNRSTSALTRPET